MKIYSPQSKYRQCGEHSEYNNVNYLHRSSESDNDENSKHSPVF